MTAIKAWLEGDPIDLALLVDLSPLGDVRVARDEDQDLYYLTAPEIDNPSTPDMFSVPAKVVLARLNGLGRVRDSRFRPVALSGFYSDDKRTMVFPPPAVLEIRESLAIRESVVVELVGPDGRPKMAPPPPWGERFALAASNSDVAEVLETMGGTEPLDWVALYKVHEIIRDTIKPQKIPTLGWATADDDSAFTASANLPSVSGEQARHARKDGTPRHTMTLDQARVFISDLVTAWLDSLT